MKVPADLLYTKEHEWIRVDGKEATVGITDYAQGELGDVVYVELPKAGESFETAEGFGSVESVKAVSQIYMPIDGKVLAVNRELDVSPELVNSDPYGEGWMIRMEIVDPAQVEALMSAEAYEQLLAETGH
jgi:glycine cleavage system H protein